MENFIFLILFLNLFIFKGSKSQNIILNNFKNYTNDSIVKVKERRKLFDENPLNIYLELFNFNSKIFFSIQLKYVSISSNNGIKFLW